MCLNIKFCLRIETVWCPAGQHLMQENTKRVNITLPVGNLATNLFGAHVDRGSDFCACFGAKGGAITSGNFCNTKINHLDLVSRCNENI